MPVTVRNQIPSPAAMKQGIVTILGSDGGGGGAHIRRTLSADMSSKKWLQQSGFFPPFKNSPPPSSSSSSSCSEGDEYFCRTPRDRDDVWGSIQSNTHHGAAKTESWDSILSQKRDPPPPPPYVHPLVKRSSSGLSEKSLEICTESLGSESGSDSFQPANCSTKCLSEESHFKRVVRYKSSPARPLPPPLQSIAAGGVDGGGPQLHMQSRRENGRLIVEAVSISPENYFEARRGNGRLVLTLVRGGRKMAADEDQESDEEEEEVEVEKKLYLPSVCEKGLVMKTFVANEEEEEEGDEVSIMQSLAPFLILARMIPTNTYEYFWRNKTKMSCGFVNPIITTASPEMVKNNDENNNNNNDDNVVYEHRKLVIVKGSKGEHLVPYSTWGCMEPRRSLLFLEPYCITTS